MNRMVLLLILLCSIAAGFSQSQQVNYYHLKDTISMKDGNRIDIDEDGIPDFQFNFAMYHEKGSDYSEVYLSPLDQYKVLNVLSLPRYNCDTIFNDNLQSGTYFLGEIISTTYGSVHTYGFYESLACQYIGIGKKVDGKYILGWIKFSKSYGAGYIVFEKVVFDTTQSDYFIINDQCNSNDYHWIKDYHWTKKTDYYNIKDTISWNKTSVEDRYAQYNLDVDNNGVQDFYFLYNPIKAICNRYGYPLNDSIKTYFSAINTNNVCFRNELLLNNGDTIFSNTNYLKNKPIEFISFSYVNSGLGDIFNCTYNAYYNALSSKYIGFSINVEGGTKLGWLRINKPLGQNLIVIEEVKLQDTLNAEYFPILDTTPTRTNIRADSSTDLPFTIYPNPVNDYFNLSQNYKDKLQIEIFDLSGSLKKIIQYTGENVYVGDLNRGIYITLFTLSNGQKTYGKLVKL